MALNEEQKWTGPFIVSQNRVFSVLDGHHDWAGLHVPTFLSSLHSDTYTVSSWRITSQYQSTQRGSRNTFIRRLMFPLHIWRFLQNLTFRWKWATFFRSSFHSKQHGRDFAPPAMDLFRSGGRIWHNILWNAAQITPIVWKSKCISSWDSPSAMIPLKFSRKANVLKEEGWSGSMD